MSDRLADVDHRHPDAAGTVGVAFRRGAAVADGGPARGDRVERLADVDHTPPHGGGSNAVWERGAEGGVEVSGDE
jgi:hypothetical protein